MVLDDHAQQDPRGGSYGGCGRRHCSDARRPPGSYAIALVANARGIRLGDGRMPRRQRRCEGRYDQGVGSCCSRIENKLGARVIMK